RVEATRSFLFPAPGQPTLGFFFVKLTDTASPRAVKDAVESVHARLGPHADVDVIAAMPHLHLRAHETFSGGSPASVPRPVHPPDGVGARLYEPTIARLKQSSRGARTPVPVKVLDTAPDWAATRRFAERARNRQFSEL